MSTSKGRLVKTGGGLIVAFLDGIDTECRNSTMASTFVQSIEMMSAFDTCVVGPRGSWLRSTQATGRRLPAAESSTTDTSSTMWYGSAVAFPAHIASSSQGRNLTGRCLH